MDSMLKKYYYSELCEMNTPAVYSDEANKASYKKEKLYKELRKNLSEEDLVLLEEYIEKDGIIDSEDEYHAFCCGIRTAIRFVADAFMSI